MTRIMIRPVMTRMALMRRLESADPASHGASDQALTQAGSGTSTSLRFECSCFLLVVHVKLQFNLLCQ